MGRKKLTAKQHEFLQYLIDFVDDHEVWPTYQAIIDHFQYRSPNSVTQNLKALHRKGHLIRDEQHGYQLAPRYQGSAEPGIPIRGIISAGTLQEAVEADLGTITLDVLFPHLDRMFAIRVSGQSMKGADIHDGDYVLLIDDDIPNGGIGAVLYDGETSLKRVYHDDVDGLRLEPANPDYDDIHICPDVFEEVRVLGRYVGHVSDRGIFKRSA
ncbi:LexA family protein [Salisaeta longa]|uniref:LexA family protein n=1 Tax=Salisaeta longa TaxID=503170 RepID=UPI0003B5AA17|nr:S24 family peptidase [Salisaeta longa]